MSIGIGNEQQFDAFHNSSLPLEILSRAISSATMTVIGLELLATGSELWERSFA